MLLQRAPEFGLCKPQSGAQRKIAVEIVLERDALSFLANDSDIIAGLHGRQCSAPDGIFINYCENADQFVAGPIGFAWLNATSFKS
mmetsp:Transcript_70011/g.117566  ORF Transcript_70011/g.117566 Transcript_70011/m.117566 type:complete len:86 (+) Transcript_70011:598-855(+)